MTHYFVCKGLLSSEPPLALGLGQVGGELEEEKGDAPAETNSKLFCMRWSAKWYSAKQMKYCMTGQRDQVKSDKHFSGIPSKWHQFLSDNWSYADWAWMLATLQFTLKHTHNVYLPWLGKWLGGLYSYDNWRSTHENFNKNQGNDNYNWPPSSNLQICLPHPITSQMVIGPMGAVLLGQVQLTTPTY